jgi:type I restriction enzyme R subunit
VPIFYESRLPELRILGQSLDKLFGHVFADRSDAEKQAIKQKFVTEQAIAGAPRRIDAICLDLLEHFNGFIRPNGFKAQIVAVNRDTAVTYQETLERFNAPASALIMSTTHNDPERLARHALSREEQNRLIDRFKDPHDPLALLVVCDMLLTGFDAPVEQVLYLDAPLKEHTLLQAIARVNRKADKKDYGLVVDYWGVSEALQDALEIFAPGDVTGAMTPKTDELPRLQTRHQAVLRFFTTVHDKQDLNACVALLEPEDVRAEFDVAFRRFSQSLDMLLPDPRALPYLPDLRWLGKVRQAARARYHDPGLDLAGCGAKVRKLIEDAIIVEGMQILVQEVSLFSREFEDKLAAVHQPEAQASEMEHAMRYEIHVKLEDNPVFYQSLRERLEAIVALRKQQRIDAAEQLKLFQALVDEMRDLGSTAAQLGLSETGYALYGLLQADDGALTVQEAAATYNTTPRPKNWPSWWSEPRCHALMNSPICSTPTILLLTGPWWAGYCPTANGAKRRCGVWVVACCGRRAGSSRVRLKPDLPGTPHCRSGFSLTRQLPEPE